MNYSICHFLVNIYNQILWEKKNESVSTSMSKIKITSSDFSMDCNHKLPQIVQFKETFIPFS